MVAPGQGPSARVEIAGKDVIKVRVVTGLAWKPGATLSHRRFAFLSLTFGWQASTFTCMHHYSRRVDIPSPVSTRFPSVDSRARPNLRLLSSRLLLPPRLAPRLGYKASIRRTHTRHPRPRRSHSQALPARAAGAGGRRGWREWNDICADLACLPRG
jgi:hypothetical protein